MSAGEAVQRLLDISHTPAGGAGVDAAVGGRTAVGARGCRTEALATGSQRRQLARSCSQQHGGLGLAGSKLSPAEAEGRESSYHPFAVDVG